MFNGTWGLDGRGEERCPVGGGRRLEELFTDPRIEVGNGEVGESYAGDGGEGAVVCEARSEIEHGGFYGEKRKFAGPIVGRLVGFCGWWFFVLAYVVCRWNKIERDGRRLGFGGCSVRCCARLHGDVCFELGDTFGERLDLCNECGDLGCSGFYDGGVCITLFVCNRTNVSVAPLERAGAPTFVGGDFVRISHDEGVMSVVGRVEMTMF
jgi:hypothetical protein